MYLKVFNTTKEINISHNISQLSVDVNLMERNVTSYKNGTKVSVSMNAKKLA